MKIFWSWQSDNHEKSGRYFVSEVLESVARDLNDLNGIDQAERGDDIGPIEVDHDTKGVPGTPPIAETVLQKIREAAVFVADVTPVGRTDSGKHLANPNVMIELGYAIHALGHHQIVLIMNKAEHGALDTLPFDLRYLRGPIVYELGPGTPSDIKQQQKAQLKAMLLGRIKLSLQHAIKVHRDNKRSTSPMPGFDLSLTSSGGPLPEVISQSLLNIKEVTIDDIKARVPKLPVPEVDPEPTPRHSHALRATGLFPHLRVPTSKWTRDEVERYNKRVEGYYRQHEEFRSKAIEHRKFQLRTLQVELCLANSGSSPATNIDVEFDIPDGLLLFDVNELPKAPEAPEAPALDPDPVNVGRGVLVSNIFTPVLSRMSSSNWTEVDSERRHVRFHVSDLKHGYSSTSKAFAIVFATAQEIGFKELPFSISANELPEPTSGAIPLQVKLAND